MLGIKQINLTYYEIDGTLKQGDVFFFGNPCENIDYAFRQLNIPPTCLQANLYNRDKIIELTDLKSLLITNVKMRENLSEKVNDIHPLTQKIFFIKDLINETALTYLKYINKLMWIDLRQSDKGEPVPLNAMVTLNQDQGSFMVNANSQKK
jgi:hypothetical protein